MAANQITFPGALWRNENMFSNKNNASRLSLDRFSIKRSCKLEEKTMDMARRRDNKIFKSGGLGFLIRSSAEEHNFEMHSASATETMTQFYTSVNGKDLKGVKEFISEDCFIEDCSFPKPFQGKKEIIGFFDQLIRSMGQNVMFRIERVCEGAEFTAAVIWHLEWKGTQIPFTRGCSFYECSEEGQRLTIKKARVLIESPIKPGGLALTLLKNLTSLFDEFPKATEWFLKSPHVLLQYLFKIYTVLLAPFIDRLLASYFKIWNLMVQMFGFALKVLIQIIKMYSK